MTRKFFCCKRRDERCQSIFAHYDKTTFFDSWIMRLYDLKKKKKHTHTNYTDSWITGRTRCSVRNNSTINVSAVNQWPSWRERLGVFVCFERKTSSNVEINSLSLLIYFGSTGAGSFELFSLWWDTHTLEGENIFVVSVSEIAYT